MSQRTDPTPATVSPDPTVDRTEAYRAAATAALAAPSVLNTQPWRWRVTGGTLDLYADRDRQLRTADPDGRLLTVSCGIALHHARLALAAAGHACEVERLPDPAEPDLLARVRVTGAVAATPTELARYAAIPRRRTDRRPYAATPVPADVLARLVAAAGAEGGLLYRVRRDQMPMLAVAAARAGETQRADPAHRAELARWIDRPPGTPDGVPASTAVHRVPRRVPLRRLTLDPAAGLPAEPGGDQGAVYAVVAAPGDTPLDWLRCGEALSAVLLTAVTEGLASAPMTDVIEVPATRAMVRRLLDGAGHPGAVVRLGVAPDTAPVAAAPRRAAGEVIDAT
jgi:hypothetical protein